MMYGKFNKGVLMVYFCPHFGPLCLNQGYVFFKDVTIFYVF